MLDVHAPHGKMEGFKDFLLHLFTITVGLLIALSLEGCVERHHQRTLVREAKEGMGSEIERNSHVVNSLRQQIEKQQKQLDGDLEALNEMQTNPAARKDLGFEFQMQSFDDVSWKTAQSTGAMGYMPYNDARAYSDIYATQDELFRAEQDVVKDVVHAASFPSTKGKDWRPTPSQADELSERIGTLKMRLLLLNSLVDSLDRTYKKFEGERS